jgi:hypothetical protein
VRLGVGDGAGCIGAFCSVAAAGSSSMVYGTAGEGTRFPREFGKTRPSSFFQTGGDDELPAVARVVPA